MVNLRGIVGSSFSVLFTQKLILKHSNTILGESDDRRKTWEGVLLLRHS